MLNKHSDIKHKQTLTPAEAQQLRARAVRQFDLMVKELDQYHPLLSYEVGRYMVEYAEARLEGVTQDDFVQA